MIRLVLLVLAVLVALAVYFLPWWSWLIILPGGILVLWLARGRIMLYLFTLPFRIKGGVLRKAAATIHAVRPIPKPDVPMHHTASDASGDEYEGPAEADDERDESGIAPSRVWSRYYEIETTIVPKAPGGPFRLWAPRDLALIQPRTNPMDDYGDDCEVLNVKIHKPVVLSAVGEDGGNQDPHDDTAFEEASKFFGPLRLTLTVGVKEGIRKLVFLYYFHKFGKVELPEPGTRSIS